MPEPSVIYVYRWNRQGRKGQLCSVEARGTMNSCLVAFLDGFRMVTSRNAVRKAKPDDFRNRDLDHAASTTA